MGAHRSRTAVSTITWEALYGEVTMPMPSAMSTAPDRDPQWPDVERPDFIHRLRPQADRVHDDARHTGVRLKRPDHNRGLEP